jgi:hypothetical protein
VDHNNGKWLSAFDLSGLSYGGQIDCYEIRGSEDYDFAVKCLNKELQLLWDNLK